MKFEEEVAERIDANGQNAELKSCAHNFLKVSLAPKYSYNFSWLGRPIIQYPQDLVAMQELIWEVRPELIIETGIAHGGSLIFYASMLELVASCTGCEGEVLGIDIDIRPHNRTAIDNHPMRKRIQMIEGSSTATATVTAVAEQVVGKRSVLLVLDSNHTHDHVLAELRNYAPFVTKGSYAVVFDTLLEDMPDDLIGDRPWGRGNNPKTAVRQFLKESDRFVIDKSIEAKLLITVAPDGYLKCVRD
jgi:cephalosporin hydroxylase